MFIRLLLITLLKNQIFRLELSFESEDNISQELFLKTILSLYMKYVHVSKYRGCTIKIAAPGTHQNRQFLMARHGRTNIRKVVSLEI